METGQVPSAEQPQTVVTFVNEIPEQLRVIPGNPLNLEAASRIIIACLQADASLENIGDPAFWTLFELNDAHRDIFIRSEFCCANSLKLSPDVLAQFNCCKIPLGNEPISVIVIPEPEYFVAPQHIDNIIEFYTWMIFADKYGLNVPAALQLIEYNMWFLMLKELQKQVWDTYRLLLTNVEQKEWNKPKFTPVVAAAGYPTTLVNAPKSIIMGDIVAPKLIDPDKLAHLLQLLEDNDARKYAMRIAYVLLASVEYCDLLLAHQSTMSIASTYIHTPYAGFFGLRCLYLEEVGMYKKGRAPGRFVLNLDTVARYPIVSNVSLAQNPYFVNVLERTNPANNFTIPYNLHGSRGVYTLATFKERFEIITDNMLKYLDWNKTAACGSLVSAAAIINPLEPLFETMINYIEEYYPSRASMDKSRVHVRRDTVFEFESDESASDDDSVSDVKVGSQFAPEFADIDIMIETESMEEFDVIAQSHYLAVLKAAQEAWEHDHKRPDPKQVILERQETENKYRYHITGLDRIIEIFHVRSIPGTVVKFHFGCVRLWYDGTNVHVFPSFIVAAKTGVNIDTRWVSCNKDLRDAMLKYISRGFGTMINQNDRASLLQFLSTSASTRHNWPVLAPPPGLRQWAINRWNRMPMFHDCPAIFNPSQYRFGVHSGTGTRRQKIVLPVLNIRQLRRTGKKKINTVGTYRGPNGLLPYQTALFSSVW